LKELIFNYRFKYYFDSDLIQFVQFNSSSSFFHFLRVQFGFYFAKLG